MLVIGLIVLFSNTASCSRFTKSWNSEWNTYDDGKWVYDRDGKRTSVSGGIVIVEEVTE